MKYFLMAMIFSTLLCSCIGDDVIFDTVPERVGITNPIDSLQTNTTFQFKASYFNAIGIPENQPVVWSSSDETVVQIDAAGLATGLQEGNADVIATVSKEGKDPVEDRVPIVVADVVVNPVESDRHGILKSTSSYELKGSFTLSKSGEDLILSFAGDYVADEGLPGLYIYLTNNPNTNSGALEIGMVEIFSGAHSYNLSSDIGVNAYSHVLYYCKPFGVKVGEGVIEN